MWMHLESSSSNAGKLHKNSPDLYSTDTDHLLQGWAHIKPKGMKNLPPYGIRSQCVLEKRLILGPTIF
jgi:hypothetical protein